MKGKRNKLFLFCFLLSFIWAIGMGVQKIANAIDANFDIFQASSGVTLYHHQFDYVQAIDLSQGAAIKFLYGDITDTGINQGAYIGDNPKFEMVGLAAAWEQFASAYPQVFSIINGQFFKPTKATSTPIAFPLKVDGKVISDGYAGKGEYPEQQLMLEIWRDRAEIKPLNVDLLYTSDAPNIIIGLTEDADKGVLNEVGRTFLGVKDKNLDGIGETILIFSSARSTQPHAAEVLRQFGASQVVMLDGGSSTQLIARGINYIRSSRKIPQAIGVVSGYE